MVTDGWRGRAAGGVVCAVGASAWPEMATINAIFKRICVAVLAFVAASPGSTAVAHSTARRPAPRPPITHDFIAIGTRRKAETVAYAERHYGIHSFMLVGPHVIVEHFTGSDTYSSAHNTFAPDVPDSELGELPGLCAQFIIDRSGRIFQQTPVRFMCRHTVGLNWTAIGVEHVGTSDAEVLADHRQIAASIALTRWLQTVYRIPTANVVGHNESLSSPYHCEHVAALRGQTHDDFNHRDMRTYRGLLGPGPAGSQRGPGANLRGRSCAGG